MDHAASEVGAVRQLMNELLAMEPQRRPEAVRQEALDLMRRPTAFIDRL